MLCKTDEVNQPTRGVLPISTHLWLLTACCSDI